MKFKVLFCAVLSVLCIAVDAHKYKSGECPAVEPASGFEMKKVSHIIKFKFYDT